jgi:hypothetical protein
MHAARYTRRLRAIGITLARRMPGHSRLRWKSRTAHGLVTIPVVAAAIRLSTLLRILLSTLLSILLSTLLRILLSTLLRILLSTLLRILLSTLLRLRASEVEVTG